MKAAGAQLLLTGNGGDEMFWGHSLAYYDRLKKGDFSVVGEVIKGAKELDLQVLQSLRSVFVRPLLQYDILPLLDMLPSLSSLYRSGASKDSAQASNQAAPNELRIPVWLSARGKDLIRAAKKRVNPFAGKKSDRAKYARYEGLHYTSTFNSMRSYQAVFDEYDLQVQHPFFSKAIAEFSFAIEQNKHISGTYPKLLLRQAMSDYLPKQVCWNTHKTVFDQHFAKLVQQNHQALRKLLQHEGLQNLGLLDNSKLLATFDALVQSETPSLNVDLLYAILVQSWYQTHILKIDAL
jgi:asparagine synthetase B (glutamine-hydrolysing)